MIIGIIGKARSGKDTFGDYLIKAFENRYNRNFIRIAFASVLKDICGGFFDLTYEQLWGDEKEALTKYSKVGHGFSSDPAHYWTPREIMQEVGGFFRKIDKDFWVKKLDLSIDHEDDMIITDVRHVNECEYVKSKNGVLIKVIRPDIQKIHGMNHESETALDHLKDDYYNLIVSNDKGLKELQAAAESAVDFIVNIENMINRGEISYGIEKESVDD